MKPLRGIADGVLAFFGAIGVVVLFVVVLALLPVFIAGVLVDYMIYRPEREQELLDRLYDIEMRLISLGGAVEP